MLKNLPSTLTDYYERIILALGRDRLACGMVILLVRTAKEPLWISQMYEACYHLGIVDGQIDEVVTYDALHRFIDSLYLKTGGLLGMTLHVGEYEFGYNDLDPDPGQTVIVNNPHRSLYTFLECDSGWSKYFGIERFTSDAIRTWLTIAEATFREPFRFEGGTAWSMYFQAYEKRPLEWPDKLLELINPTLQRYMCTHLPAHMLDHERENETHVPSGLLTIIEQENFVAQHWTVNTIGCGKCGNGNFSEHERNITASTVLQFLVVHNCELTTAQCIQSDLAAIRKDLWVPPQWEAAAASLVSAKYACSEAGRGLLRTVAMYTKDNPSPIPSESRRRSAILRLVATACNLKEEEVLATPF